MRLKDILVQLDATEQGKARLQIAADLARRHDAHLTGLHVIDLVLPIMPLASPAAGTAMIGPLMDALRDQALAAAAGVEAMFHEQIRRDGIAGEWRLAEGLAPEQVALHARYADLLVLGQADPEAGAPSAGAVIEAALFASGRPVLLVPHAGSFPTLGRRVLVGWNAGREATRAVHDALPLLAAAESVTVLAVNPAVGLDAHGEEPGADIARHLARHGVTVTTEFVTAAEAGAEEMILNRAAELGADLLVVGGYGHSRLRELVLGGVTRRLLRGMTLPVLMSH